MKKQIKELLGMNITVITLKCNVVVNKPKSSLLITLTLIEWKGILTKEFYHEIYSTLFFFCCHKMQWP